MRCISLKQLLLCAVTASLVAITGGEVRAACDNATITGSCSDLSLPNSAGNTNYFIDTLATVSTSSNGGKAIAVNGVIASLTNNGSVNSTADNSIAVYLGSGSISGDFVNNGTILGQGLQGYSVYIDSGSSVGSIMNSAGASIIGENRNGAITTYVATVGTIDNAGLLKTTRNTGWAPLALLWSTVDTVRNSGQIYSDTANSALAIAGGSANTILNSGLIYNSGYITDYYSTPYEAMWFAYGATVGTITNTGSVVSAADISDVYNGSTISTLNNLQGVGSQYVLSVGDAPIASGPLTYRGNLPSNYNMIVYGDQYGQLAVDYEGYSGSMNFGIFGGDAANGIAASQLKSRVYEDVVTGVDQGAYDNTFNTSAEITDIYGSNGASFGNYNGVAWMLTDATYREDSNTSWDLIAFNFGADLADPQRNMLEQRQLALRNALDYDCKQFDKNGICVSVKGRYSSFGDYDESAGILVVSKRLNDEVHIGGFIDERITSNEVNGISNSDSLPMYGVFADYAERKDGTGIQARISTGLHRGTVEISRTNILGAAASASGKTTVDSFGVGGAFGWGFAMGNKQVLSPYVGLSFLKASRAAYDEASASGVLDPLGFASYSERRTVGTAGVKLAGPIGDSVSYHLGVGVDYELDYNVDSFDLTSAYWGNMSYTNDTKPRQMRVNGSAGLGFAFDANKTLTLDGNVSQMDYSNLLAYSFIAGFQMGF